MIYIYTQRERLRYIDTAIHTHTMGHPAMRKKEILPFPAWVDPDGIMLSEISQKKKRQRLYDI